VSDRKSLVITVYGHDKTIDTIMANLFDDDYHSGSKINADTYCGAINKLELKGDAWISSKIISENTRYSLDEFLPLRFDIIPALDDRAIQKVIREVDPRTLARALKNENEAVREKIFNNMSKRAAQMLKEDMEYMGPMRRKNVIESKEKILAVIRYFEEIGEIVIPYSKAEIIE
jgi:flagellar motor switch protein FliG